MLLQMEVELTLVISVYFGCVFRKISCILNLNIIKLNAKVQHISRLSLNFFLFSLNLSFLPLCL